MHQTLEGLGVSGFIWWEGVVESRQDPLKMGRVQVRIAGFHTPNKNTQQNPFNALATEDLPWAVVLMPVTSAGMHGLGTSMHSLVEGTTVFGFFRDGERGDQPVIMGVIPGITESVSSSEITPATYSKSGSTRVIDEGFCDPRLDADLVSAPRPPASINDDSLVVTEASKGVHYPHDKTATFQTRAGSMVGQPDTHKLARGISSGTPIEQRINSAAFSTSLPSFDTPNEGEILELLEISEPETFYGTKYPYNKVTESESGHLSEEDDTPGFERIHRWHRSGTFYQMNPDGSMTTRVNGKNYTRTMGNKEELVEGDHLINVKGRYRLYSDGVSIDISGGKVTITGSDVFVASVNDTTFETGGTFTVNAHNGIVLSSPDHITVSSPTMALNSNAYTFSIFPGIVPPIIALTFMMPMVLASPLISVMTGGLSLSGLVMGTPLVVGGSGMSTPLQLTMNTPVMTTFTQPVTETYTALTSTVVTSTETVGTLTQTVAALNATLIGTMTLNGSPVLTVATDID